MLLIFFIDSNYMLMSVGGFMVAHILSPQWFFSSMIKMVVNDGQAYL